MLLSLFWSLFCSGLRCMTSAQPLPEALRQTSTPAGEPRPVAPQSQVAGLVPAQLSPDDDDAAALRSPVARLPVELDVAVPIRAFRVRHLLALAPGHVLESQWRNGEDVPLQSGDVQLAWSEFEVVDTQLAVRVTRLA